MVPVVPVVAVLVHTSKKAKGSGKTMGVDIRRPAVVYKYNVPVVVAMAQKVPFPANSTARPVTLSRHNTSPPRVQVKTEVRAGSSRSWEWSMLVPLLVFKGRTRYSNIVGLVKLPPAPLPLLLPPPVLLLPLLFRPRW